MKSLTGWMGQRPVGLGFGMGKRYEENFWKCDFVVRHRYRTFVGYTTESICFGYLFYYEYIGFFDYSLDYYEY